MKQKLNQLKNLILNYSYQKREVTLASGKKSNFYFDGKQTTLDPQGISLCSEMIVERIQQYFPQAQAVGGPTLGADPLATGVSMTSYHLGVKPLRAFIVRKAPKGHGTMSWIEGASHLKAGMRVVLLEDVITTGGSLISAAKRVQKAGLYPVGVIVLVDREEGGRENIEREGLKVVSLFKKSQLIEGN